MICMVLKSLRALCDCSTQWSFAMVKAISPPVPNSAVHIEVRDGKWIVRVFEDSNLFTREFIRESHAASFAEGQRIRLGLHTS